MKTFSNRTAYVKLDNEVANFVIKEDLGDRVILDPGLSAKTVVVANPVTPGKNYVLTTDDTAFDIDVKENDELGSVIFTLNASVPLVRMVADETASEWLVY